MTGIEELQKLEAKLKLLHDHLNSEADPQRVKGDVDWCYRQCCTVSRKIKRDQSNFKNTNYQLAREKDQFMSGKERVLYTSETEK